MVLGKNPRPDMPVTRSSKRLKGTQNVDREAIAVDPLPAQAIPSQAAAPAGQSGFVAVSASVEANRTPPEVATATMRSFVSPADGSGISISAAGQDAVAKGLPGPAPETTAASKGTTDPAISTNGMSSGIPTDGLPGAGHASPVANRADAETLHSGYDVRPSEAAPSRERPALESIGVGPARKPQLSSPLSAVPGSVQGTPNSQPVDLPVVHHAVHSVDPPAAAIPVNEAPGFLSTKEAAPTAATEVSTTETAPAHPQASQPDKAHNLVASNPAIDNAQLPGNTNVPSALLPAAVIVPEPVPTRPVEFTGLDYVPDQVIARMQAIAMYREVIGNRYALATVPRSADWGRTPRTEKKLCLNGKALLIWFVARTRSLWFFDRNGDPHLRVNIGTTVHCDQDRAAIRDLFGKARPRPESTPETVYAGRICSQRGKGEYCDTATAFTKVYDATTRLGAKSSMPQLSPVDLGKNDIIVVECHLTRWKRASEGKAKKSWNQFDVGFELNALYLLYSAPADVDDRDVPEAENDIAVEL